MRKLSRKLALLLSAVIMMTALTLGGPSAKAAAEAGKPDISKEVTLTMYLLGDRPVDNEIVFEKINERLKSEINATIDVKYMSWSEYEQKYPLIFASGEDWDIIYTSDWCFYNAQATKQGFFEITQEDLNTYAPMTAESIYTDAWEQTKVDGKVYMLPMNFQELTAYVWMARGDLMDKYGIESVSTFEETEKYMQAIVDNEPGMIPLGVGSDYDRQFVFDLMWGVASLAKGDDSLTVLPPTRLMTFVGENDPTATAKSTLDADIYMDVLKHVKDWKDRGFWSRNAVVNTQNNTEIFHAGKSALALMNINTAKSQYATMQAEHPEWDVRVFDAMNGASATIQPYLANGMSIFSKSKNPQRALMALDYLRNDEMTHDLFSYGIEGLHWEKSGERGLKSLPQSNNYSYDGNCNWGIRNDKIWLSVEGGIPNSEELNAIWKETAKSGRYLTFVFDDSQVKNEVAAMSDIYNSDYKLLQLGFTDNPEADVAKLKTKMAAAGAEKIQEAFHTQALAFLEKNQVK